jgi:hypothetical protein
MTTKQNPAACGPAFDRFGLGADPEDNLPRLDQRAKCHDPNAEARIQPQIVAWVRESQL